MAFPCLAAGALVGCGGGSASGTQGVDTDISVVTTDLESLPMGSGQACITRLTKIVDVDYLREHPHEAAHEVVHAVEDVLD